VETYPLNEPYAYASIVLDPESQRLTYKILEPVLSEFESSMRAKLREIMIDELEVDLRRIGTLRESERFLAETVRRFIKKYKLKIELASVDKILYYLTRDFIYYGKIDPLMRDAMIEDISCDGTRIPLYIWHRRHESLPTNVLFDDDDELDNFTMKLTYLSGRHISIAQPMVDAVLPEGSRLQATFSNEVTRRGSTFTIRKFKADPLTITDLLIYNTLSVDMAAFCWFAIENRASVMIAGGIACGKTTILNCFSMFIKPEMKIVSIEDTPELNIPHENWIQGVTRLGFGGLGEITLFDLLKASMRQRPDYIIVGEIRGQEAYTLFQAMSTGHLGMCTIHADSISSVIHRLESEPMNIPRTLVTTMDLMTIQARTRVGEKPARRSFLLTEMVGLDSRTGELLTNDVYRWDARHDAFIFQGRSYFIEKVMRDKGLKLEEIQQELLDRKRVLSWMVAKGIRRYIDVSQIIYRYYADKKPLMELVEAEAEAQPA
jgi:archaeal flagellar protein FlaI